MGAFRVLMVAGLAGFAVLAAGCAAFLPDRIHRTLSADTAYLPCPAAPGPRADLFGVALSGGGSRAAVYAAAGLEALWQHGLLDRITHLSSVSGGSMAASYFVANRPACDEEASEAAKQECWRAFFAEFKQAMRYDYSLATGVRQLRFPNRWTSHTRRASSFQEVLDRKFLDGKTFGDLYAADSGLPVLLVNAASYDEARRFLFSNVGVGGDAGPLRSASFARPGCRRAVPRDLPLSLAVTASAAFPGLFGPVALEVPSSCEGAQPEWWHLGDGGMIDNSGLDTLEEVALELADAHPEGESTAVLVSFDASRVLRSAEMKQLSDYGLLTRDPSRIVIVTKARGEAYSAFVWEQRRQALAARGIRAEKIPVRYMAAELSDWPASCKGGQAAPALVEEVRDRLEQIPTKLTIDDCSADLLERAAHQVLRAALAGEAGERLRALGIPFRTPPAD
ncbi:MAG: patatin-like phospholipase family protein [Myxococcota bacterium]